MLESKQSQIKKKFPYSSADNSRCYCQIWPIIELIQDLIVIYIVTMFGTLRSTFVDARV